MEVAQFRVDRNEQEQNACKKIPYLMKTYKLRAMANAHVDVRDILG